LLNVLFMPRRLDVDLLSVTLPRSGIATIASIGGKNMHDED